jgi:DNA polymerase III subunit delta'
VIGHAEALDWLRRALASDRLAHAYLISGPRGVGRRTFALHMAKALNCLADELSARPDGTCQQCRLIERNVHPDVRVVRRGERPTIRLHAQQGVAQREGVVDYVDWIQGDAQLRPVMARKKVYLIVNAEELAQDAADRLLKTLEEPPLFVTFLLTAVERGGLFPTIASRCHEIRLHPAGRSELTGALEAMGAEPERALQLAALSGGRQAWAVAAVRDPRLFEQQQAYAQQMVEVVSASRLERLQAARYLSERWQSQPEMVRETLRVWLSWWRDVVLMQLGLGKRVAHLESHEHAALASTALQVSRDAARDAAANLQQSLADLDANVNPRLVLDLLVLHLPRAKLA